MNTTNYMETALQQARLAAKKGEVPIGAVIVRGGKIIAKTHNMRERKQNALAHAEIIAIHNTCKKLKSWRLDDCIMYVTLEPCPMCAGAIINARIKKVIIGALAYEKNQGNENKSKSQSAINDIYQKNNLNWKTEVEFDEQAECSTLIKNFFRDKRNVINEK